MTMVEEKLPTVVTKTNLYSILGKAKKQSLKEILELESEFKSYLRPVIEEDQTGWGFITSSMIYSKESEYQKIF
jgi:formiminotetrahydrofolate cyclodeaminase